MSLEELSVSIGRAYQSRRLRHIENDAWMRSAFGGGTLRFKQTQDPIDFELPDYDRLTREHRIPAFRNGCAYAGIASIARRKAHLRLALESLYDQVDHFFIYLNEYGEVPDWLIDQKFTVFRSQDYIDLNATGKVFFAGMVDRGYYFTLDDDFVYPANYIDHMVATMERYGGRVASCVHGSIFPPNPSYYYLRSAIYQYQGALTGDRFVCLPGTGSFAVKAGLLDLSIEQFLPKVMVDLTCAILCRLSGVPLVSVARRASWMQNMDREGLYHQFTKAKTHHTFYANECGPWDFDQYAPAIREIAALIESSGELIAEHDVFDHDAFVAAREGTVPANWTNTAEHYGRVAEVLRLEHQGFFV